MKVLTCDLNSSVFNQDFASSLKETGFAVITGHSLEQAEMQRFYEMWAKVFEDNKLKQKHLFTKETQSGYFPFKSENAKGSSVKDLKEFWHIYPNRDGSYADVPVLEKLPGIGSRRNTFSVADQLESLAVQLLEALEEFTPSASNNNLGWGSAVKNSDQTLFRILHYPPLNGDEEPDAVRAAAHEDINLLTLLPVATAPGLQVQDKNGEWLTVSAEQNSIIVNCGDMLEELTNGYYKSTTHRVVNPAPAFNKKSRYSAPLFLHPSKDFMLSSKYTAGEYLTERLKELGLI